MSKFTTSFTSQLDTVLNDTYTNFRGRLIEKLNSHSFRVGKNTYSSLEEAKEAINESYYSLYNSIVR